jgi:menaquinone-dependent protoporphyrinogen oxidase
MTDKILVAYASRAGSTARVAEVLGQALAYNDVVVDVRSVKEVTDLSPYRAVVVGSAIHAQGWLPEAMQFLQMHRTALAHKPCATSLLCMTLAMRNGPYLEHVATWMEPVRALVKPVSEGLFAGVLDIGKIPSFSDRLKFRLSVALGVWAEGDHRDWDAIRAWGERIYPLLSR